MKPEKNKQRSILRKPAEVNEPEKEEKPPLQHKREATIQPLSKDMMGENIHAQRVKPVLDTPEPTINSEPLPPLPDPSPVVVEQAATVSTGSSPVVSGSDQRTPELMHLSASQVKNERRKLPIGIYIIIAANFLAFVTSFFNTSENSLLYTYSMLFSLLIAIGLMLRFDVVRKIYVWLGGILIVLTIALMIGFFGLQERADQLKASAESYYSSFNQSVLTPAEQQQLANQESTLNTLSKEEGKLVPFFYIYHSIIIVIATVEVIYLIRPSVKDAFQPIEK